MTVSGTSVFSFSPCMDGSVTGENMRSRFNRSADQANTAVIVILLVFCVQLIHAPRILCSFDRDDEDDEDVCFCTILYAHHRCNSAITADK